MARGFNVTSDEAVIYKQIKTNKNGQEFAIYSSQISNKDNSGNWKSAYFTIKFASGIDLANKTKIKINKGFISFNPNTANGERYPFIFVSEYEVLDEGEDSLRTAMDKMDDEMPFM